VLAAIKAEPTNGTVQVNDVSENVRPINKMLNTPVLCPLFAFKVLSNFVGNCISNAPNKLKANTINNKPMAVFTHGFDAKSLMPVAPNIIASKNPIAVKVSIIPNA